MNMHEQLTAATDNFIFPCPAVNYPKFRELNPLITSSEPSTMFLFLDEKLSENSRDKVIYNCENNF